MTTRRIPCMVLGLACLLGSVTPSVEAGFVTQTVSTSTGLIPTDFTKTLAFKPFDATLGSLESIVLSFSDNETVSGYLKNKAASSQDFTISQNSIFTLSFAGTALLTDQLAASQGYTGVASGQTVNFNPPALGNSVSPTLVLGGPLFNAVIGTSNVNFIFATATTSTVSGNGGNRDFGLTTLASATVTVTYNYITTNVTVPEPASVVTMMLGGLLASSVAFLRGRRSSRARVGS